MKSKNKLVIFIILVLIFFSIGSGCPVQIQDPDPPLGHPEPPPLPGPLQDQEGEEPMLKVFVSETDSVEDMHMEEYIAGVVAAEMNTGWPEEALAAQAVIARSFTLQKISENGGVPERGAHASTEIEEFQAYDAEGINDNVRGAVQKTRGQAAIYENDYIRGWFHAYAGPRTALADEGLEFEGGNPPYIQIVDSPGEMEVPEDEGNWSAEFPLTRLRSIVKELAGEDPGPVKEVVVAERGPSGRATSIRINDEKVSAPSLRLALDSTVMRSTFIEELTIKGENVFFAGTGYGHGVGMCQWGAKALAQKGKGFEEIIEYYYKNVSVARVWD